MMAMAASPTPSATAIKAHNHPPYKEMIVSAIDSLKERKGSSKTAIAKYIESKHKNLPPTHNALLSHHLCRLKKQGVLQMVVKSYKLSDSGQALQNAKKNISLLNPVGIPRRPGRPPKKLTPSSDLKGGIEKKKPTQEGFGPHSEKRKPGRPRKSLSPAELILPSNMKSMVKTEKRKPGRPRKWSSPAIAMELGEKSKPGMPREVLLPFKPKLAAALELGGKRKRGRPKKLDAFLTSDEKRTRGQPKKLDALLTSDEKRTRGPPKKLDAYMVSIVKRKRGWPKKFDAFIASNVNRKPGRHKKLDAFLVSGEKMKLGRPKKLASVLASGEKKRGRPKKLDTALSSGEQRKRGRPKINLRAPVAADEKRKPGRPKNSSPYKQKAASMVASGEKRKRGRPKKLSAVMVNGGENVAMMPLTQCTVGGVSTAVDSAGDALLAVLLAANTVEEVSAAVENGGVIRPNGTSSSPEKLAGKNPIEGSRAMPLLAATESGEKRKRGRPKKGLTPSISAPVNNSCDGILNGGVILPNETSSSPEKFVGENPIEGSRAMPLLAAAESGEKRKRGRPKKGLTPSALAAVNNGGDVIPNSMPSSAPKKLGRPPKKGLTPSALAAVNNGGDVIPNSMPSSAPKKLGRPSKKGNPDSVPEN